MFQIAKALNDCYRKNKNKLQISSKKEKSFKLKNNTEITFVTWYTSFQILISRIMGMDL